MQLSALLRCIQLADIESDLESCIYIKFIKKLIVTSKAFPTHSMWNSSVIPLPDEELFMKVSLGERRKLCIKPFFCLQTQQLLSRADVFHFEREWKITSVRPITDLLSSRLKPLQNHHMFLPNLPRELHYRSVKFKLHFFQTLMCYNKKLFETIKKIPAAKLASIAQQKIFSHNLRLFIKALTTCALSHPIMHTHIVP